MKIRNDDDRSIYNDAWLAVMKIRNNGSCRYDDTWLVVTSTEIRSYYREAVNDDRSRYDPWLD